MRMSTTTKKDLIDQIAAQTNLKRTIVKKAVHAFLDAVIRELGDGNRLELRDFGVFEVRERASRVAQNPKTLERVSVPPRRTVKFKIGRLMKMTLDGNPLDDGQEDDDGELDEPLELAGASSGGRRKR
jgi:integration host factor subunit beta